MGQEFSDPADLLAELEILARQHAPPPRVPPGVPPAVAAAGPRSPKSAEEHRARLRHRLLTAGPDSLADHELLEIVLFLAVLRRDTKALAYALLHRFGSYANVLAAPATELMKIDGVGESCAAMLKSIHAAALRLAHAEIIGRPILNNWDKLLDYLTTVMARDRTEQFRILFLDSRNRLLADEPQARGTVNHTPVYPREVVKRALELNATALILTHNHPSGDPTPSHDDIVMTRQIAAAAQTVSITVHDHIIIGNGAFTSFRREGLLP
jgi:DNA repair protein RadC